MSRTVYCSTEATTLTAEEAARLDQLPDAAEDGHAGPHIGLGQSQDHDWEHNTNWWLRWTDDGGREWTHEASCPAERGHDMCVLPVGHAGQHHWM